SHFREMVRRRIIGSTGRPFRTGKEHISRKLDGRHKYRDPRPGKSEFRCGREGELDALCPMELKIKNLAFEGPRSGPDRGFTVKAYYLLQPEGEALVEIYKDGETFRRFLYPAYKVWNIA